jgi:DNA-directed RNA polymerase subunit H (RpoH/RPB5)
MNLHFPQSIGAQAECQFMMNVAQKIITRQSNGPIVGIVQNTLVSMYMLTRRERMVDTALAFDLFVCTKIDNCRVFNLAKRCYDIPEYKKYISIDPESGVYHFTAPELPGKIVASIFFPESFNFYRHTNVDEKFPIFKMEKGVILPDSGPMCKKIIGITKSSCIGVLWNRPYNPDVCCNVISELQILGLHYITRVGFSFGVTDCIPTGDEFIHKTLTDAMVECENINASNKSEFEKEGLINNALNKTMGASATLAKKHMEKGDDNSLVIMKVCGAKGTDVNNGQIAGFTGQQNLDGARIKRTLNGTRCLPTFQHNDNSPAARGFVANSLMKGLTPDEAFFYSISGRRGNIDTAIKTADCGYIQKKITKKGEDASQKEDGTVRDASGNIIQFLYGNDGFNAKKLVTIKHKGADVPYFIDLKNLESYFNNKYELSTNPEDLGAAAAKRKLFDDEIEFAVECVYTNMKVMTDAARSSAKMIAEILEDKLREVMLYDDVVVPFIEEIERTLKSANNATGESVGLIAGCSIGEPATQMTLNTHQFVGVSEKEVMGVTRLKELIGATPNPSNPTMSIFLSTQPEMKFATRTEEMVYKAHKNTLEMLNERGYDTSTAPATVVFNEDYEIFFTVTDSATSTPEVVCILFLHLDLNKETVEHYIHSRTSTYNHIIVVYLDKITPSASDLINVMKKNFRLEFFNIKEMQYNPLKHVLVPKHEICTEDEKKLLIETYAIKTLTNFPGISTEDPIVRRIGAVKGQLVKITRKDLVYKHGFEVLYRIVTSDTI